MFDTACASNSCASMRQDGRGVAVVAQVVFGQCRDWRAAFCTVLSNKGFESRLRIKTANHHAKAFPDYAARSPRVGAHRYMERGLHSGKIVLDRRR
jgi:hypothetical protein